MGAYLRGEKLDFGRKCYIKQDRTLTKGFLTSKIPADKYGNEYIAYNRAHIFLKPKVPSVEEQLKTAQIRINKNNVFLCDSLNFDNIIKGDIADANKLSIENGYVCYLDSSMDVFYCTPFSAFVGVFDFDFSLDENYIYITMSCSDFSKVPGAYVYEPEPVLSYIRFGGFLGLIKYDNKYIIYDTDSAVEWTTDRLSNSSQPDNKMAVPIIDTSGYNAVEEIVSEINSNETFEYTADTEEIIYYLLHTYLANDTDITKPIKGSPYFEEIHPIYKSVKNRRITNV